MKTTTNQAPKELSGVIQIDEGQVKDHLGRIVRGAVEETLNAMLEAKAAPASWGSDPRGNISGDRRASSGATSRLIAKRVDPPSRGGINTLNH